MILFGVGKTDTEGIYSLRAVTGNDGLPVDTIIAFESSDDAERCCPDFPDQPLCSHTQYHHCCRSSTQKC